MATYVISDLHGEYEKFKKLLEIIHFSEEDKLYILGDVLDRGKHPVKILQEMMMHPNMIGIAGNHEMMALRCLRFLLREITDQNVHVLEKDERIQEELTLWLYYNGGPTTLNEFTGLEPEEMRHIMEYIEDFLLYEEVTVEDRRNEKHADGKKVLNASKGITAAKGIPSVKAPNSSTRQNRYLLVHAGLGNFSQERELEDYSIDELVWAEMDFERKYFDDRYLVVGHVPTQMIKNNPRPGYIYRAHNNIAIDCGACFDGRLAAICLETGEEFYSDQE